MKKYKKSLFSTDLLAFATIKEEVKRFFVNFGYEVCESKNDKPYEITVIRPDNKARESFYIKVKIADKGILDLRNENDYKSNKDKYAGLILGIFQSGELFLLPNSAICDRKNITDQFKNKYDIRELYYKVPTSVTTVKINNHPLITL